MRSRLLLVGEWCILGLEMIRVAMVICRLGLVSLVLLKEIIEWLLNCMIRFHLKPFFFSFVRLVY